MIGKDVTFSMSTSYSMGHSSGWTKGFPISLKYALEYLNDPEKFAFLYEKYDSDIEGDEMKFSLRVNNHDSIVPHTVNKIKPMGVSEAYLIADGSCSIIVSPKTEFFPYNRSGLFTAETIQIGDVVEGYDIYSGESCPRRIEVVRKLSDREMYAIQVDIIRIPINGFSIRALDNKFFEEPSRSDVHVVINDITPKYVTKEQVDKSFSDFGKIILDNLSAATN